MPFPAGVLPDGRAVTGYNLGSPTSTRVTVLDLGATIVGLSPASSDDSVVLAYPNPADYLSPDAGYLGATVGRFANRIAGAQFSVDGVTHRVSANENGNCLHGGADGFHARTWSVVSYSADELTLELVSADGDQGFPGEVTAQVRYRVDRAGLGIEFEATTSATTPLSLTNHCYFNLAGAGSVDDHELTVFADRYLDLDERSIPTSVHSVDGTVFDLRSPTLLGPRLRAPELAVTAGLDHPYLVRGSGFRDAARLNHPPSGLSLLVSSDLPSLQVYTGNQLTGSRVGATGALLRAGDGVCLESQLAPDSPNQPALDDAALPALLRPGASYRARVRWDFETCDRDD